jgi:protein subunit release factor A
VPEKEKVLSVTAHDCKWETFRAGGSGGQNQNSRSTGVRCTHPPSGAVGEARDSRKQIDNKRAAFRRMADSKEFRKWIRVTALHLRPVEEIVDEQMRPENLKIEYL